MSWAHRRASALEEQEHLLAHHAENSDEEGHAEEHADSDGLYPPHSSWTSDNPSPPNPHAGLPVYWTIHRIRRDIIDSIDDPYSLEQLKAPRMNISVVRPLVDQFYAMRDVSIVYCLLVNRCQFIREQSYASHHQTVNLTRAHLCELIAEKILRRFNEHNPGPKGLLLLANILVAGFEPFQNAPEEVLSENSYAMHRAQEKADGDRYLTSLEIAIISESKSFLASQACRKVTDAIHRGKLVYTPSSFIDIIPDRWKHRPISLYDPRRAPLLNQYRLAVPRIRNFVEVGQFIILLALYVLVLAGRENRLSTRYSIPELVFDIYAAGWVLDQFASILEHGWQVYSQNLWSFLDVGFALIFCVYLVLRMHALSWVNEHQAVQLSRTALDILSIGAPILIPRLAFNLMSENMLFVSLRGMMSDFLTLTLLAVWCFGGFLLSLKWLHAGHHKVVTISKWMIWIWFGLDGTGIQRSPEFQSYLGPALMVLFAFLGNTLFLTILVSMLTNTFSLIVANGTAEIQYRRAVLTFLGVKSDALFSYMPPFNILALVVLLPLKSLLADRWFHKVNAAAIRVINAPLLLLIGLYERRTLWVNEKSRHRRMMPKSNDWRNPRGPTGTEGNWFTRFMAFWDISRFSVHGDVQTVFDQEPPQHMLDEIDEMDDLEVPPHIRAGSGGLLSDLDEAIDPKTSVSTQGGTWPGRKTSEPDGQTRTPKIASTGSPKSKSRSGTRDRTKSLIEEEFQTSSANSDSELSPGRTRAGRRKKKRKPKRMDSIVDYTDAGTGMGEANARLQNLENSLARVEAVLLKLVEGNGSVGGEEKLEQEVTTGILE